jgi:hypothetical protein
VNYEFMSYTSNHGIIHQTTCPSTPPQNGVAERKKPTFVGSSKIHDDPDECAKVFVE